MKKEEIKNYLDRIGFTATPAVDLDTLAGLQLHHLLTVPFENLDIHRKKPIEMEVQSLYEKIVRQKRGGFCYELNTLFNELLVGLGFKTTIASARVFSDQENYGEEYDHLCLIVLLDNENWLADVGFGSFSLKPIKIDTAIITQDPAGLFKIEPFNDTYLVVKKMVDAEWKNQYLFSMKARDIREFAGMCHYHQTSPLSHFTRNRLCSIATPEGRISLTDRALKITEGHKLKETTISDDEHFRKLLFDYFGIKI